MMSLGLLGLFVIVCGGGLVLAAVVAALYFIIRDREGSDKTSL